MTLLKAQKIQCLLYWKNGRRAYVFALAHCGAMGTLNRNRKKNTSLDNQLKDWRKIKEYLNR